MTPNLDSVYDWLKQISHAARPIKSTTQIWELTRHQNGISALVSQTLFRGETRRGLAKCRLFSQARSPATEHSLGNIFVASTIKNF